MPHSPPQATPSATAAASVGVTAPFIASSAAGILVDHQPSLPLRPGGSTDNKTHVGGDVLLVKPETTPVPQQQQQQQRDQVVMGSTVGAAAGSGSAEPVASISSFQTFPSDMPPLLEEAVADSSQPRDLLRRRTFLQIQRSSSTLLNNKHKHLQSQLRERLVPPSQLVSK